MGKVWIPRSTQNTLYSFSGMQMEREELARQILPHLRPPCESRGVRWGEENLHKGAHAGAAADQLSMEFCRARLIAGGRPAPSPPSSRWE